jgi:hypothetical protein
VDFNEETFVTQLAARGAKAVTSIEVFGIKSRADKADTEEAAIAIRAEADKRGMSHVILTFLVGVEEEAVLPPEAAGMDAEYRAVIYGSTGPETYTYVSLATYVYEVETRNRVWTRTSKTLQQRKAAQGIESVIKSTMTQLGKDGLI